MPYSLDDFTNLVTSRRTNLRVHPELPVGTELIEQLCRLATWAPNHKMTEPWRFAALVGDARRQLGEVTAQYLADEGADAARIEQTRNKYLRAPVVIVVASATDQDPIRTTENRDAVAAGVQNMLLGATAAGLNSYWGTGPAARNPETNRLCGFEEDAEIIAVLYLGWPIGDVPVPERAPPRLSSLGE